MPGPLDPILSLLFAAKAPAPEPQGGGLLPILIPLIPILILYYFLIIRPQQSQAKQRRAAIDAIRKNDRVVTIGGIFGTVVSVDTDGDRVTIRVDDDKGVKMVFRKASVERILGEPDKDREKTPAASPATSE